MEKVIGMVMRWSGDKAAMRDATKESEVENIYGAMDDMMFKGIQYFCQLDRGILAYSCYPAAGNERFYDDNVWIGLDMVD